MNLKTEIDISLAVKVTAEVIRKLPFAVNNALTRTAKEMVIAGQNELAIDFTLRKKFILNRLKILQYSRTSDLTAIVGIDTKVQGTPLILGYFEDGGTKEPDNGPGLAVPITGSPVRPTFSDSVVRALQYTKLQLQLAATGNKIEGLKNTYVVPGVGVFQRVGPGNGPDATVLIYKFESSVPLKKRMSLTEVMTEIVNSRFDLIFNEEFEKEITRQKPKR
jgi:hypothetical protein